MDDAGSLVERDLVPGDHAVLEAARRRQVVERALVRQPDELRARAAPILERLVRVARAATHSPFSLRPYSASGMTAAATFAGSVHGVVVQTTSDSPGRSTSGKRTKSDGSVRSS